MHFGVIEDSFSFVSFIALLNVSEASEQFETLFDCVFLSRHEAFDKKFIGLWACYASDVMSKTDAGVGE